MKCKICGSSASLSFSKQLLKKYLVNYFKCNNCGFIQTEDPYWLEEAYTSAITSLDIGLLYRNLFNLPVTSAIIYRYFNSSSKFIDYGGGYGIFTRIMRDKGFKYFRQDIYCENLFAKHFDINDFDGDSKYEMLTAFEVFEHLPDPDAGLKKMLDYSDNILFSTELIPKKSIIEKEWWYLAPETGQHIAFYSKESLAILAKKNDLNLYTNGTTLHLLTRKKVNPLFFKLLTLYKVALLYCYLKSKNNSLLIQDFEYVKQLLTQEKLN